MDISILHLMSDSPGQLCKLPIFKSNPMKSDTLNHTLGEEAVALIFSGSSSECLLCAAEVKNHSSKDNLMLAAQQNSHTQAPPGIQSPTMTVVLYVLVMTNCPLQPWFDLSPLPHSQGPSSHLSLTLLNTHLAPYDQNSQLVQGIGDFKLIKVRAASASRLVSEGQDACRSE